MLDVGRDSYVDLKEAEFIINKSFMSNDKALKKWNELSESDKEVLLSNSCISIDSLRFDGRKKIINQILQFPRCEARVSGIGYSLYCSQFVDNSLYSSASGDGGLGAVKQAQVINAVYASLYNDLTTDQIGVNIQGITSKKAGPISESYNRNSKDTEDAMMGIYSKKVYSILRQWLNESRISM